MPQRTLRIAALGLISGILAGCMSPDGATKAEKQAAVRDMRANTLAKLYELRPEARARVENAVGHGVFSNIGVNLVLLSAGSGWGVVRDNRSGDFAELKTLVRVGRHALRDGRITAGEKRVFDLVPELLASNGWISDKPEGVAVTRQGRVFLVTDNDGVDDWSGETWFLDLGPVNRLFFGRRAADREPRHIDLPGRGRGRDEDG